MEHSYSYDIQDIIIKNPFDQYDIFIFNPEFIKYNIFEVKFSLQDNQGIKYELINNLEYSIYNGSLLFRGKTKSDSNIFPIQNIPLSYIKYHSIYMVIHNINLELKNILTNKKIIFKWTESITHPPLNIDNSHHDVDIEWITGIDPDNINNRLRITHNMTGIQYNSYYMDENYIKHNSESYLNNSNKNLIFNINHLDEYYNYKPDALINFDYYCFSKSLELLCYVNNNIHVNSPSYVEIISETCKITPRQYVHLGQNNNIFKYKIKATLSFNSDSLTNIKLLCDNSKYLVKKINLLYLKNKKVNEQIIQYESVAELEVKSESYGYKVAGLDNYLVIITMLSLRTDIEIELDSEEKMTDQELDNLAIVFNRMVFNQSIRIKLSTNLDYIEEYYVTDIGDYYENNY